MLDFIAVPFGYVMRFIYEGVGSYGLSIILFTLLTQIILLPFNWKQKKGMMDVQRIQPKMLELQKKYANNREKMAENMERSLMLVTALTPHIGYQHAADIAKRAIVTGQSVRKLILQEKLLTEEEIDTILDPMNLTKPGIPGKELLAHK